MQGCQEFQLWLSKHTFATQRTCGEHNIWDGALYYIGSVHVNRREDEYKPRPWGQFNISSVITTDKRCKVLQSRRSILQGSKDKRNAVQHKFKISTHAYPDSFEFTSSFHQPLAPFLQPLQHGHLFERMTMFFLNHWAEPSLVAFYVLLHKVNL